MESNSTMMESDGTLKMESVYHKDDTTRIESDGMLTIKMESNEAALHSTDSS